jgi:YD repeat-containing protein
LILVTEKKTPIMMNRWIIFIAALLLFAKTQAQINLQTGSATFSLPMFSWQDNKSRLNSIVALSYNSGNGLRVSDVASNAGQGWNMIAGGVITRMQVGEPDDQVKRDGTDGDITKYPSGILYAGVPAFNGCPNALASYPIYGWKNQIYSQKNSIAEDRELDYFSFQFNGKAGMFVLDPTNVAAGGCQSLGDTKMKITFQKDDNLIALGIRTNITSFTIQDVDGLIYKFSKHGLTKVLQMSYTDEYFNYRQSAPKFKNDRVYFQSAFDDVTVNPWVISGWYLTEIKDPLTLRTVVFNYVTRYIDNTAGEDISYNKTGKTNTPNNTKDYGIITHKVSKTESPVITSIVYPDGHNVTFNYGKPRVDLRGDNILSSVDITYQGRYLSKYELNTSYFILNRYGTPVTDFQKKVTRLCLLSVRKIGIDLKEDTPPYIFDYYTGSNLPDDFVPAPFTYARDIWGFYNGDKTKGYNDEGIAPNTPINTIKGHNYIKGLCHLREGVTGVYLNAKPGYAKNGLLKQIIYPTGGTLTYQYEQNTGTIPGNASATNVGGVHVSQTSSTDGGYTHGCDNPIITKYNYVLDQVNSPSSMWGLEMPVNKVVSYNHYQPEYKSYHWNPLKYGIFGKCYWHFQYPGILNQQQAINLTNYQRAMETVSAVMNVISILSTIKDAVTAFTGGSPVAFVIDVAIDIAQLLISCIGDEARDYTATVFYNFDLNSAAPLPAQFKRVEVVENQGGIGKTVQEFTSEDEYPVWVQSNPVYSAKQRFATWAYGLPKRTIVYNAAGNIIKEDINEYNFIYAKSLIGSCFDNHGLPCNASGLYSNLISCKCEVVKSSSLRNTKWTDPANNNSGFQTSTNAGVMNVDYYGMYSGRVELDNTSQKIFASGGSSQYTETSTRYTYNLTNYEVNSVTVIKSNGDKISKYSTYSCDYYGGVFDILNQNNIVSTPVSTVTLQIPVSGLVYNYTIDNNNYYFQWAWANAWYVTNESVTEFINTANGDIKPLRIIEQRFDKPRSGEVGSFLKYPGPAFADYSKYKILQTFTYDAAGNLTGVKDEGGRTISNIYDYNDKYIAASVINADAVADKSAYTSFETSGLGNWTLTGASSIVTTNGITGTNSFTLSPGKSFSVSALNTLKPYTLSFWVTTAGITVTGGATLIKSAPSYNGFTYYEYAIAQGTAAVTVAGSGAIDELRLYPKTARMRTMTYDPLIGKTSDCDENNRITYYEYDKLGRLQFVKDEKKNIVKMHEYNNISAAKQNGCPVTYYNYLITEKFTKTNCGPGYRGADVPFSVPANTYSSSISQADADAKAEQYLLANGQNNANNTAGACQTIYYNAAISVTDTTETCGVGFKGGLVTYTVPAGKYSSVLSQADADEMALDDLEGNADSYMNDPAHAICILDTDPDWTWLEDAAWQCQDVGGGVMHMFVFETDINPNSATYNQTRWSDVGPEDVRCPTPACSYSMASGYTKVTGSINNNGTTASGYLVLYSSGSINPGSVYTVATINGTCRPSATQTIFYSSLGRSWTITIYPSGQMTWQLTSGTGLSPNTVVGIDNFTYNL